MINFIVYHIIELFFWCQNFKLQSLQQVAFGASKPNSKDSKESKKLSLGIQGVAGIMLPIPRWKQAPLVIMKLLESVMTQTQFLSQVRPRLFSPSRRLFHYSRSHPLGRSRRRRHRYSIQICHILLELIAKDPSLEEDRDPIDLVAKGGNKVDSPLDLLLSLGVPSELLELKREWEFLLFNNSR